MGEGNSDSDEPAKELTRHVRNAVDLQRMKLEKLMKNPSKPVYIPDSHKDKKFPDAPEFVRNVMGSSAGAGSGEFHVYRHIRRREYSRELYMQKCKERAELDSEHVKRVEDEKKQAENKTAKKRRKRQRRKELLKHKRKNGNSSSFTKKESSSESDSEDDEKEHDSNDDHEQESKVQSDKDSIRKNKLLLLKNALENEPNKT